MFNEREQQQDQPEERKNRPAPADYFRAWQEGGRERLGELLDQMDQDEELVIDRDLWAAMTEDERGEFFFELSRSKKTFIWTGIRCIYDSGIGPVSWSW